MKTLVVKSVHILPGSLSIAVDQRTPVDAIGSIILPCHEMLAIFSTADNFGYQVVCSLAVIQNTSEQQTRHSADVTHMSSGEYYKLVVP